MEKLLKALCWRLKGGKMKNITEGLFPSPYGIHCCCAQFRDMQIDVTAIIVPVKIIKKGAKLRVSWACNYGRSCENSYCRYANGRQLKKSEDIS